MRVFKEDGDLLQSTLSPCRFGLSRVGPEHAYFKDSGRVEYVAATDEELSKPYFLLSKTEGIIPRLKAHMLSQKQSNVRRN